MTEPLDPAWLAPTWFIDSDSDEVAEFAATARATAADDNDHTDVAVALFYAVRDGFRYDPYVRAEGPEDYRASSVAGTAATWGTPMWDPGPAWFCRCPQPFEQREAGSEDGNRSVHLARLHGVSS